MPATLENLYDIQTYVESASAAIISNEGIGRVHTSRGAEVDITPRIECVFRLGQAGNHYQIINDIPRFDTFTGNLSLTIVTDREVTAGNHSIYQSKILNALKDKEVYNSGSFAMPYHQVQWLAVNSIGPTVEGDKNLDLSGISYDMRINISATQWPS